MRKTLIACVLLAMASMVSAAPVRPDIAQCLQGAGVKYRIDWKLLQAIAEVESGMNPVAIGYNRKNGKVLSEDLGIMQINSSWLPVLREMKITRDMLLSNPCQNIHVGAWILAKNIAQNGVNWTSIGAYNAGFRNANEPFRMRYAHKVYARYLVLMGIN